MPVSDDAWDKPNEPVYVRFGPRDNQVMPLDWAEQILTNMAAKHRAQFGRLLQEAALGER
jgi:hypothetical protein